MAEGYFNYLCRQTGTEWLSADSAGIYADRGSAPSPQAIETMKRLGIDISGHRSAAAPGTGGNLPGADGGIGSNPNPADPSPRPPGGTHHNNSAEASEFKGKN